MAERIPRIAMLAGNDVTSHPRVLKCLATARHFGLDVTAVGLSPTPHEQRDTVAGAPVIRVPVAIASSVTATARTAANALRPWYWTKQEYAQGLVAFQARQRAGGSATALRAAKLVLAARSRPWKVREKALIAREGRAGVGARRARLVQILLEHPELAPWRRVLPEVRAREAAIVPVLTELDPDLIHVHDVFLLGVAVEFARLAGLRGRSVKVVYDAHENIPGLAVGAPRWVAAYAALEAEFITDADRVVTVSPDLADLLERRHHLPRRPELVFNAPVASDPRAEVPSIRDVIGIAPDVPLAVYAGGVGRARGVATVVDALAQVPQLHLAIVAKRSNPATKALLERAVKQGVEDRVSIAPFVPPEQVPEFLSGATLGLSPLLHVGNHDVALTNKFCEYIVAGLPVVTSDTHTQAELVRELGLGAVHRAGDAADCAAALRAVLADAPRLSERIRSDTELIERFSWSAAAAVLRGVWADLVGPLPERAWAPDATQITRVSD